MREPAEIFERISLLRYVKITSLTRVRPYFHSHLFPADDSCNRYRSRGIMEPDSKRARLKTEGELREAQPNLSASTSPAPRAGGSSNLNISSLNRPRAVSSSQGYSIVHSAYQAVLGLNNGTNPTPPPTSTPFPQALVVPRPVSANVESQHKNGLPNGSSNGNGTSHSNGDASEVEALRQTVENLTREGERRECAMTDLVRKLDDAVKQIKVQKEEIHGLRVRLGENVAPVTLSPPDVQTVHPPDVAETLSSIGEEQGHKVSLQILQHPPTQAVYQRILRPFPTVAVVGASHLKTTNNLFVEVSLLRQHEQGNTTTETNGKSNPDKKHLIGGQLVQRSEWGPNPDKLIVVFRKLKILTTTAQQGGSFFVLKFILKRYVDNNFEVVPGVALAISDPMEVFSHTLYLKSRNPNPQSVPPPLSISHKDEPGQPKRSASPPPPQSRDKMSSSRNRSISLPPAFAPAPPSLLDPTRFNPNGRAFSLIEQGPRPVITHPMDVDSDGDDSDGDSLESQASLLQLLRRSGAKKE
ncbi:IPT/TIG domain-containing protein [Planoprotostelium fungivorum]|uniref:IPT/TIG domain-containing protein n=1 Tax=Planoprotostelium fungivorum TaxID=1890364 RepID=A0A2P6NMI2_9EUKA|nr:IPT/TIG domain-containing protein [Planoprotostelium fungivorum]